MLRFIVPAAAIALLGFAANSNAATYTVTGDYTLGYNYGTDPAPPVSGSFTLQFTGDEPSSTNLLLNLTPIASFGAPFDLSTTDTVTYNYFDNGFGTTYRQLYFKPAGESGDTNLEFSSAAVGTFQTPLTGGNVLYGPNPSVYAVYTLTNTALTVSVPEPATLSLAAVTLLPLLARRRRKAI